MENEQELLAIVEEKDDEHTCPVCQEDALEKQGRCLTCRNCGWSLCSV